MGFVSEVPDWPRLGGLWFSGPCSALYGGVKFLILGLACVL